MTIFILLGLIAGQTVWLYRLGAFNGAIGWAVGACASIAAFWDQIAALATGWWA